jgi:integrase
MSRQKARQKRAHTGHTAKGHVRDIRIERIGRVTIYKRGSTYYLYYRDHGESVRRKVEGNLAAARSLASKVLGAIEEGSPSPLGFTRISIPELLDEFVDSCESVQSLAPRTVDRYRAAVSHFKRYAKEHLPTKKADQVTHGDIDKFVKWLRGQRRTRNGAEKGRVAKYSNTGRVFILNACRTAFNWGRKRRYLPPYAENPFSAIGVGRMRGRERTQPQILTPEQQRAFFEACDDWQRGAFLVLAVYGLRVGELTHLLISDVDLKEGRFEVRSKPQMFWSVKTQRERTLPIPQALRKVFERCMATRREGLLFVNREFAEGRAKPCKTFVSRHAFLSYLSRLAEGARKEDEENERSAEKAVKMFLREMGQIPEKRVRQEFMKLTKRIGCPELTRAHSLRHLFSTRVQEQGVNPLLVQGILGHTTLDMTWEYTHFGLDAKGQAIGQMLESDKVLSAAIDGID